MPQYLVIFNRGTADPRYFELIGLSTKRHAMDDPNIIGFKGSGSKLSPLAALRLGLDLHVASHDEHGPFLLSYEVHPERIGDQEEQRIFSVLRRPCAAPQVAATPFLLSAFADWDQPIGCDNNRAFKVVRELICNARDADAEFVIGDVAAPDWAPEGHTVVYLKMTDAVRAVTRKFADRYLKFLSGQKARCVIPGVGAFYPKSDPGKTRLFVLGTLVSCESDGLFNISAVFDYSLDNKSLLSEERLLKSETSFSYGLARLLTNLEDVTIAAQILRQLEHSSWSTERTAISHIRDVYRPEVRQCWLQAAYRVFGDGVAVGSSREGANADAVRMGLRPVDYEDGPIGRFLAAVGVPLVSTLVFDGTLRPGDIGYVAWKDIAPVEQEKFMLAFNRLATLFPERAAYQIRFVELLSPRMQGTAGLAGGGLVKEILIVLLPGRTMPDSNSLFVTLLHESRHCQTSAADRTRTFENAADNDCLKLALLASQTKPPRAVMEPVLPNPPASAKTRKK